MELCLSYFVSFITSYCPGPILESKGLRAAFQRKGQKRAKYLKIWAKMSKFENILKKGSLVRATIACIETARICPNRQFSNNLLHAITCFFQNIFKFCTFLPKFSNFLPFLNIFCLHLAFGLLKNCTHALTF